MVEPRLGAGAGHLVPRVLRDLVRAGGGANRLDLLAHDRFGVRTAEGVVLLEVGRRREVERHLQAPVHREPGAGGEELVVARGGLERSPGRQFLVRIGHDEPACVELRGHVAQVTIVRGVGTEPGDIHPEHVVAGVAVHDPVREREADAGALREARHDAAGRPVVGDPVDGPHEGVAIRGEREGSVDPTADAGSLQHGEPPETDRELGHDPVELLGEQGPAEVPVRPLDHPVARMLFVDAQQDAAALLLEVGEALEIGDGGHVALDRRDLRDLVGHEVVVGHRHERVIDAHHPAHPPGPQTGRVDHVLGDDVAPFGLDAPLSARQARQRHDSVVLDHLGTALAGSSRVGLRRTVRIQVALQRVEERPVEAGGVHDGHQVDGLPRREEVGVGVLGAEPLELGP